MRCRLIPLLSQPTRVLLQRCVAYRPINTLYLRQQRARVQLVEAVGIVLALQNCLESLESGSNEVMLSDDLIRRARQPLQRMMDFQSQSVVN